MNTPASGHIVRMAHTNPVPRMSDDPLDRLAAFTARRREAHEATATRRSVEPPLEALVAPSPSRRDTLASGAVPAPINRAATQAALADYDARRCAFCGSPRAWFGYGPPLVRTPFWTCGDHRPNAEACVIAGTSPRPINPSEAA
jgi:hypothetical protein